MTAELYVINHHLIFFALNSLTTSSKKTLISYFTYFNFVFNCLTPMHASVVFSLLLLLQQESHQNSHQSMQKMATLEHAYLFFFALIYAFFCICCSLGDTSFLPLKSKDFGLTIQFLFTFYNLLSNTM